MIYDVTLKIAYAYPAAVKDARHILRIRPREGDGQEVIAQSVRIVPKPDQTGTERDFFENAIDHVLIHHPHEALSIEMRARVRVGSRLVTLADTPPLDILRREAPRSREAGGEGPAHFVGTSRMLKASPSVETYIRDTLAGLSHEEGNDTAGQTILALTRKIRSDFKYAPGTTKIDTPVEEVMEKRGGVCQDFAHLMITGLRGNGIPAAYVSGFLRTDPPAGKPRLEGADAMHAWVKVWLGAGLGWVGFDPTNGCTASADHIEVAIGRDYADVAPVSGVLVTSGPQKMRHSVDVVPVEEG